MLSFFAQVHTPSRTIEDIHEVYGPVYIEPFTPIELTGITLGSIAAITLLTFAVFAYLRYRKRKAMGPPLTPIQIAERDLSLLKTQPPATDALWGQCMSEILRIFIQKTHNIQAIESTTEELSTRITPLPTPVAESLMQVLERCDFTRFAARPLSDDTKAELIALAEQIIRFTPPVPATPENPSKSNTDA